MFLLIQNSPPATESARLGNSNAHRSTDADVFGSTALLVSRQLHIELLIAVTNHVQDGSYGVTDAIKCRLDGVLEATDEGEGGELRKGLKHVLVSTLDPIELVSVLVVTWRGVEVRILDVQLLSRLHHQA